MHIRVKICGITNLDDAKAAIKNGADAIGLVFYPPSPRNIDVAKAAEIVSRIPPFVTVVGLFVNAQKSYIDDVIKQVGIDLIQFHGEETEAFCQQFSRPYIKALRMKDGLDLKRCAEDFRSARALLLDTYKKGIPGGTGETFNWELIPESLAQTVILAGGLNAGNVMQAIAVVKPFAVDVSGGVEQSAGLKDHSKIKEFTTAVLNSFCTTHTNNSPS